MPLGVPRHVSIPVVLLASALGRFNHGLFSCVLSVKARPLHISHVIDGREAHIFKNLPLIVLPASGLSNCHGLAT